MAQRRFALPRRARPREDLEPVCPPRQPLCDTSDSSELVERIDDVLTGN